MVQVGNGWIHRVKEKLKLNCDQNNFVVNYSHPKLDCSDLGFNVSIRELYHLKKIDNILLMFPIMSGNGDGVREDLDKISRINLEFKIIMIDVISEVAQSWIQKDSYIPHCITESVVNIEDAGLMAMSWDRVR